MCAEGALVEVVDVKENAVEDSTDLLEGVEDQEESPTALTMEEAEEQANFYVWTPKGVRKGAEAGFFQKDSVVSDGQVVSAAEFQQLTQVLAGKTDNPATMLLENGYLAMNTRDAALSFVGLQDKGRKGKGRKPNPLSE